MDQSLPESIYVGYFVGKLTQIPYIFLITGKSLHPILPLWMTYFIVVQY